MYSETISMTNIVNTEVEELSEMVSIPVIMKYPEIRH